MCACSPSGQLYSGLHQKHGHQSKRGDCSSATPSIALHSALDGHDLLEKVQRPQGSSESWNTPPVYEERMREMGLLTLDKRRLQGDLTAAL